MYTNLHFFIFYVMFEYNYEYDQYSRFFRFYFQVLLLDRARVGRVVHHERTLRSTHDGNGTGNRTGNRTRNGTVDSEDVLAGNTIGGALAASVVTCHDDDISVALERWKVKSVFIVHVGGTRCVPSSTDNILKIRARITLTVEFIRTCIFLFLFYV